MPLTLHTLFQEAGLGSDDRDQTMDPVQDRLQETLLQMRAILRALDITDDQELTTTDLDALLNMAKLAFWDNSVVTDDAQLGAQFAKKREELIALLQQRFDQVVRSLN